MEGAVEEVDDAGLLAEFYEGIVDHVGAEHREEFVGFSGHVEGVGELERVLEVDVVVGEAVDEEERARGLRARRGWPSGECGRGGGAGSARVCPRRAGDCRNEPRVLLLARVGLYRAS